jgi:hypothetical protein
MDSGQTRQHGHTDVSIALNSMLERPGMHWGRQKKAPHLLINRKIRRMNAETFFFRY